MRAGVERDRPVEKFRQRIGAQVAEGYGSSRESAERQVSAWELGPSPGYVDALVQVVAARGGEAGAAATGARLLAAICLKNVAARRWRPRRGEALGEDEKARCRAWLVEGAVDEQDRRVAAQLELCARRVARADWPREWRGAPRAYLEAFARGGTRAPGALRLYCASIKELARKGLPRDRRAFAAEAAALLPATAGLLENAAAELAAISAADGAAADEKLEEACVLAKAATRLLGPLDAPDAAAANRVYDVFRRLDACAIAGHPTADPKWRRKLQTVVVPRDAWRRRPDAFSRAFGAPFLSQVLPPDRAASVRGLSGSGASSRGRSAVERGRRALGRIVARTGVVRGPSRKTRVRPRALAVAATRGSEPARARRRSTRSSARRSTRG